jgi:cyclophilin family peptidyl-prolyl cis-trans isomerase
MYYINANIGSLILTTDYSNATNLKDNKTSNNSIIQNIKIEKEPLGGNPYAIIETSMGTIRIELFQDLVPNTVDNFIKLAEINFFDGLVFHRVIDDFVIQGGGHYPNGTRKESPFGPIDLEIHQMARHVNGAIGMARTANPNSATSQFYICDGSQHPLDDKYAVFGRATLETLSVVGSIASVETTTKYGMKDWPVDDVLINSTTIKAKTREINTPLQNILEDYPSLFHLIQRILPLIKILRY